MAAKIDWMKFGMGAFGGYALSVFLENRYPDKDWTGIAASVASAWMASGGTQFGRKHRDAFIGAALTAGSGDFRDMAAKVLPAPKGEAGASAEMLALRDELAALVEQVERARHEAGGHHDAAGFHHDTARADQDEPGGTVIDLFG